MNRDRKISDNKAGSIRMLFGAAGLTMLVLLGCSLDTGSSLTVTYNGNGSDGGVVPVDSQKYAQGDTLTLKNAETLKKTNHTFAGWNTKADGKGNFYLAKATYHMGASDVTFYAQWTGIGVHYNGNGSDGGIAPTDNTKYVAGVSVILAPAGEMRRSGYIFSGWNTKPDGTGTAYTANATYSMGSEAETFYAQWDLVPSYAVTYNGTAYDGGTAPTDLQQYVAGASVILKDAGTLNRAGYTFSGWNTKADGTGTTYTANAPYSMRSEAVTFYAQWAKKIVSTYTVAYDGNEGTGAVPVESKQYAAGESVILKGAGTLSRAGYTFSGWNTKADGTGTTYTANATYPMGSDAVTFYAQWDLIPTYEVTYNGNGSDGGAVPVELPKYAAGASVILKGAGTLSRAGYQFVGWNTKADGMGTTYTANATYSMGSNAVIFYAQWLISTYAVIYNGNGSDGGIVPVDSQQYVTGESVIFKDPGTLSKTGYGFLGWSIKANGESAYYRAGAIYAMRDADTTLYARWIKDSSVVPASFSIAYSGNGADGGESPRDSASYPKGSSVIVPGHGTLTKTGYIFTGWKVNENGEKTLYVENDVYIMKDFDTAFLAQWDLIPTYEVTYNGNGSDGGAVPVELPKYAAGASVILKGAGTLSRAGYTFSGWNTKADGTGTTYTANAPYSMGSDAVIFYAQWKLNEWTITFDLSGGGGTPPGSVTVVQGTRAVLPQQGTMTTPVVGDVFAGWTEEKGSGSVYAPGLPQYIMPDRDVTLYAKWDHQ